MITYRSKQLPKIAEVSIFSPSYDSQKVLNLFARISEDVGSSLDYWETATQICKVPVPLLANWCSLFITDEKTSTPVFVRCFHPDPVQNHILSEYFRTESHNHIHRPIISGTLQNGCPATEIHEVPSPLAGYLLTLPLIRDSEVLGLMTFGSQKDFAPEDILLAEEVSRRAAIALNNSRRYQQIRDSEAALTIAKKISDDANQAKSQFLANLSHEIRTPVSAILGFTELLLANDPTAAERLDWGLRVKNNGHQLLRLINDLLNLTKIEQGQLSLEYEEISFVQFYENLSQAMCPQARVKNVSINFSLVSAVPATFTADNSRLQQILINVVGNAIKFTEKGNIAVSAGFQKDSGLLFFDVEDTGPGLTNKEASKLFLPFSQAGTLHSKRCGGSGLGLALSANLARLLGGDLELVSSQPGVGSIFRVFIKPKISDNTPFISELIF